MRKEIEMKKVVTSLLITLILAGCLVIGLAVSAADTPALTIRSASLSLESNVYIWFDMSLENVDKDADDYGMIFWKTTQKAGSYTYENAQGNEAAVVRGKSAGQWAHDDTLNCDVVTYKQARPDARRHRHGRREPQGPPSLHARIRRSGAEVF